MKIDVDNYYKNHVDKALSGNYDVHGDPATADCLIGASYGYRERDGKFLPGLSNEDLAEFAFTHFPLLPKILQFEIADAYEARHDKGSVIRISQSRAAEQRLDTPELVEQCHEIMRQHGYTKAIVVAHPNHMP